MATADCTTFSAADLLQPLFNLDLPEAILRAQRLQWEALASWQKSLARMQNEFWDEWVCRWAGGAPIDA